MKIYFIPKSIKLTDAILKRLKEELLLPAQCIEQIKYWNDEYYPYSGTIVNVGADECYPYDRNIDSVKEEYPDIIVWE